MNSAKHTKQHVPLVLIPFYTCLWWKGTLGLCNSEILMKLEWSLVCCV